jgi:hypothetical protein
LLGGYPGYRTTAVEFLVKQIYRNPRVKLTGLDTLQNGNLSLLLILRLLTGTDATTPGSSEQDFLKSAAENSVKTRNQTIY